MSGSAVPGPIAAPYGRDLGDVGSGEMQVVLLQGRGPAQHFDRRVDTEGIRCVEPAVQLSRQLAGPTSQVDDTSTLVRAEEREQVEEGCRALHLEGVVLRGIPSSGHAGESTARCIRSMLRETRPV